MSALAEAEFRAIGTRHNILALSPHTLTEATRIARERLAELDLAASRFRADSELSRLAALAAEREASVQVSPLLLDQLLAARRAFVLSGGIVDATVGAAVIANGYDADLEVVRSRSAPWPATVGASSRSANGALGSRVANLGATGPGATGPAAIPGWDRIELDEATRRVTVPRGTVIDLGATAKAHAADLIARELAARLPGGFLVNLGGDIATSGDLPACGWRVGVQTADGAVGQVVELRGQALATSSTQLRTWATTGGAAHHIVDPRTGRPAPTVWAQVSCVAANALEANIASTAAIVLGEAAPAWLSAHGIPARLDRLDGGIVTTPGWPAPEADSPDPTAPDKTAPDKTMPDKAAPAKAAPDQTTRQAARS
ncbi:thiamine biosynthesis lipoprotein [Kineosphaera limosa]|uniref:FAD:protein FMN transferase n=1 Tax=Kineosphaera limosa NBRC 100340 TaxID=1184609 RepID=K6VFB9_9MICO|nr:FAD:protein FMN transferase [Kineosphaera limosa]NYE00941.1 thiamine biosynthesis lipoprotein [Kineosphaera limosa]GAB94863.1 hypothetical protein KILIM_013_00180 [Kineosphaera limosa NBRC 100340]